MPAATKARLTGSAAAAADAAAAAAVLPSSFQSRRRRAAVLAAFWLAILAALPAWWHLTSIERRALPEERVAQWAARRAEQACAVRTPLTLQLEVPRSLLPEAFPFFAQEERYDDVAAWSEALQRSVQRALSRTAECHDVRLQVSVEGSQSPSSKSAGGPLYRVSLASDAALAIDAPSSGGHGISLLSEHLSEQLAALFQLAPSSAVHSLREIPYAMRIRTVWHLLNEDAAQQSPLPAGLAAWDARALDEALDRHVGPIARALRGTHRIGRESQSHWWAPLAFEPELRKRQVAEAQAHDVYAEPASEAGSSEAATADSEASEPVEADDAASTADTPLYEPQNDSDEHAERVRQAVEEAQFARDGQEDSPLDDEEQAKEEEAVEELLAAVEQPDEASATAADASASETGLALPELPAEPATEDVHVITPEQLQVFVNSAEWSLSSPSPATAWEFPSAPWLSDPEREAGLALRRLAWGDEESDTERTLHFCVFVPSPKHRPLYIDEATSESARGFLVPQWGGVVLYNPPAPEDASSSRNSSSLLPPFAAAELDDMMPLFASQLRSLLGLRLPRSPAGSTEAQRLARRAVALDALLRRRIAETANEAVDTLHGIIRLVHKITNLGVGKQVQDDVRDALEALDMLDAHLALPPVPARAAGEASPDLERALMLSSRAAALASRAFFNRDMIKELYFPQEHKMAVYTPFFGPVAVPLLVGIVRLIKRP